ncbi:MAG: glutamate racemase [Neisseriaceae bacterium]|nr:glutamate racemase [Neisseriaceae bacterium]
MIGFFDSGLGGLSVWRTWVSLYPSVPTIYVADQAYCPYGERSVDFILARADKLTRFLQQQGVSTLVIACNTATSAAGMVLRTAYPNLIIVGIEPALKPAMLTTKTRHIGVLATAATLTGKKFQHLLERVEPLVTVTALAGEGWVACVEKGDIDNPEAQACVDRVLADLSATNIDQWVLGCTHYPFLAEAIQKSLSSKMNCPVTLIDPAPAVCRQAALLAGLTVSDEDYHLANLGMRPTLHQFYTTAPSTQTLQHFVEKITDIEPATCAFFTVNIE